MSSSSLSREGCPGCQPPALSRRDFLRRSSMGFGSLAFAALAQRWASASGRPLPHFPPRAKRVVFLFMDGGVSHVDSFDKKEELNKRSGQPAKWRADALSQAVSANRKW